MAGYRTYPFSVSDEEKAFGIPQKQKQNPIMLRNWITYLMRTCISEAERRAYYSNTVNIANTKIIVKNAISLVKASNTKALEIYHTLTK